MSCGRSRARAVDFALGVQSLSPSPPYPTNPPVLLPRLYYVCVFIFLFGSRRWKSVIERFVRVYNYVRMLRAVCFLLSVQKASCTSAFLCTESQLYVCLPPMYRNPVVRLSSSFLYRKPESYICLTPPCTESQSRTSAFLLCTEIQSRTCTALRPRRYRTVSLEVDAAERAWICFAAFITAGLTREE